MDLGPYFEPQLVEFIDTITRSTNSSKEKSSMLYEDLRCSRVRMIIALLCFTMNPQCCFIQTIVGLMCYAYGLWDKGIQLDALAVLTIFVHMGLIGLADTYLYYI